MADKMDKFFGLNTPSGKAALVKEREKLDAEIKERSEEEDKR